MEVGQGQVPRVRRIIEDAGGYASVRVVPDEAGIERVVIAQRAG
jgi:methylase of polypeptide subunit release factors